MDVVGSLSSPISSSLEKIPTSIDQKSQDDPMAVSYRIIPNYQLETKVETEAIDDQPMDDSGPEQTSYTNVSPSPINVQVSPRERSTLKTGRRSKVLDLEDDVGVKREKRRREQNRINARRFRDKQTSAETELVNEVNKLEDHQKYLISKIIGLQSYKRFLDEQCQEKTLSEKRTHQNDVQMTIKLC